MAAVTTIVGYSLIDGINQSNKATFFVALDPFDDRHSEAESVWGVLDQLRADFLKLPAAIVIPFNLPPIIGLGTGAGFEYQLQSYSGRAGERDGARSPAVWCRRRTRTRHLAGVFTTYGASTPLIRLDIDRERAETLGIGISDIFTALQAVARRLLASTTSTNSAAPGRSSCRPRRPQRMQPDDIFEVHVRAAQRRTGADPHACHGRERARPRLHLPLQQSARGGDPGAAGVRLLVGSGAWRRWSRCRKRPCRRASAIRGAAPPTRKRSPAGQTTVILALAVLFAYLVLVGLYESWAIPAAVIVSVTVGLAGRARRAVADWAAERRVCADRHRRADRTRRQERDPDRRVRDAGAARRAWPSPRRR